MKRRLRGQFNLLLVALCVVLGLAGAVGLAMRGLSGAGGGAGGEGDGGGGGGRDGRPDSFTVRRGEFDISLPVSGELVAQQQIEVRNKLEKSAIITEIAPEGQWVNAGDVLLKLNDEELRNKVRDGIDEVNVAEAAAIAAEAELEITMKERDSERAKADLAIHLAQLALQSWKEGEDNSKRRELALALETAQKNADRLQARFKESAGLLEKKFISLDEYKQDEIAMIEANAKLEQAGLDIDLYERFTFEQDKAKKESDLDQARSERERVEKQYEAKMRTAQSEWDSKKYQLQSKRDRLRLQEQQLSYCTITAPSPGLVVYYSSLDQGGRWGGDDGPPQVGTEIHSNQLVIILPNTSRMIAEVKVSEALSGLIKPGLRATVTSDAMPDRPFEGEVQSVGVLAQSGGWRDPNRREYTVKVLLSGDNDYGLKPAMRCKAHIYVGRVDNALHIPVQAVFRTGPLTFVYVPDRSGYSQRKVVLGKSSELFVEVLDGLAEGATVLLREPEADEIVSRLPAPKNAPGSGPRRGLPGPEGENGEQNGTQGPRGNREGGPRRGGERDGNAGDSTAPADASVPASDASSAKDTPATPQPPSPAAGDQAAATPTTSQ